MRYHLLALIALAGPALAAEAPAPDQLDACFNAALTGQLGQCRSRETLRNVCLAWPDTGRPLPDACLALIEPGVGA